MAHNGINEIMTPITGIRPRRKIMIASANKLGNPKIHRKIVDNIELTNAIRNCTSITLPKECTNFLPKNSSSINRPDKRLALNLEVKFVTFSFSNRKNKLRIIATNKFKLHLPISDTVLSKKSNPWPI
ncbi:hypothetical protein D3C81_1747000 [compost metagenome]